MAAVHESRPPHEVQRFKQGDPFGDGKYFLVEIELEHPLCFEYQGQGTLNLVSLAVPLNPESDTDECTTVTVGEQN